MKKTPDNTRNNTDAVIVTVNSPGYIRNIIHQPEKTTTMDNICDNEKHGIEPDIVNLVNEDFIRAYTGHKRATPPTNKPSANESYRNTCCGKYDNINNKDDDDDNNKLIHYSRNHTTTYGRFRSMMFSVNVSVSFLIIYLGNIWQNLILIYLLLFTDALMAMIYYAKKQYSDKTSRGLWEITVNTLRAFRWSFFAHGTLSKACVYSLLLLITHMVATYAETPLLYKAVLLLLVSGETKSLDKYMFRLFNISVYERVTSLLLQGPLHFLNIKENKNQSDNNTNKPENNSFVNK